MSTHSLRVTNVHTWTWLSSSHTHTTYKLYSYISLPSTFWDQQSYRRSSPCILGSFLHNTRLFVPTWMFSFVMQLNFLGGLFAVVPAVWYLDRKTSNRQLPCFFFNGSVHLHSPIKHPDLQLQLHTVDSGAEKCHQLFVKQEVGTGAWLCQGHFLRKIIISSC